MVVAWRWTIPSLVLLAVGVSLARPEAPVLPSVSAVLDPVASEYGVVTVTGISPALRRHLEQLPEGTRRWTDVLAVRATAGEANVPPLAGKYSLTQDGALRFEPRYPPDGPLIYLVRFDPNAFASLAGHLQGELPVAEWQFAIPGRAPAASTTAVEAIHPSTHTVPANQLRWYLDFSAPMREGEAISRVHLVDDRGKEVRGAFLDVSSELWDSAGRRLTMLFDPGRVKRGIRTRMQQGPVLEPGRSYTIRVDAAWSDSRGAPLARTFTHRFQVGGEDSLPVTPAAWLVKPPLEGSRNPLELDFGEPLDHALALGMVEIQDPAGRHVAGRVELSHNDSRWHFTPAAAWLEGQYRLLINPALEDLAGNRVDHLFDADLEAGQSAGVDKQAVELRFRPKN